MRVSLFGILASALLSSAAFAAKPIHISCAFGGGFYGKIDIAESDNKIKVSAENFGYDGGLESFLKVLQPDLQLEKNYASEFELEFAKKCDTIEEDARVIQCQANDVTLTLKQYGTAFAEVKLKAFAVDLKKVNELSVNGKSESIHVTLYGENGVDPNQVQAKLEQGFKATPGDNGNFCVAL